MLEALLVRIFPIVKKIALILLKKFLHIVSEVGKARDGNLGDGTY